MKVNTLSQASSGIAGALAQSLNAPELLLKPEWEQWMAVQAPFATVGYSTESVQTRFHRNGYDWDVHGTLLIPEYEVAPGVAFVMTHGGASSEYELLETPDRRAGVAAVIAAQGFRVLCVTWVGHHHPSGRWEAPLAERMPIYLFDRDLPAAEVADRMLRCTYNVTVEGIAQLADLHLPDRKLMSFGHSTGGPMSVSLQRFLRRSTIGGIVGWGSGGPNGWFLEWLRWIGVKQENLVPMEHIARRTVASFRSAGYEGDPGLCPWGGAEGFMRWSDEFRSQLKTSVCENQHKANVDLLGEYAQHTGLPVAEFTDHLLDPNPDWLARTPTLLMIGVNDRNHWFYGEGDEEKLEVFIGRKFEQRTPWTKVVLVPRYSHYGYVELHNEKIAYLWLWAMAAGHFDAGLIA